MVEPYRSNQKATQAPSWSKDFMTLDWEMSLITKRWPPHARLQGQANVRSKHWISIFLIINKSRNFILMPFGSSSLLQEHMHLTWTWNNCSLSQQRAKFYYSMRIPETVVHGPIIFNGVHQEWSIVKEKKEISIVLFWSFGLRTPDVSIGKDNWYWAHHLKFSPMPPINVDAPTNYKLPLLQLH